MGVGFGLVSGWSGQGRSGSMVGGSSGSGSSLWQGHQQHHHSSQQRPGKGSPTPRLSAVVTQRVRGKRRASRPGPSGPRLLGLQCSAEAGSRSPGRSLTASRLRAPGCLRAGCLQQLLLCFWLSAGWLSCGVSFPGRLTSPGCWSQEITVGLPPWKASCPCPCAVEERGNPGTACPMPRDQEWNKRATKRTKQAVISLSLSSRKK